MSHPISAFLARLRGPAPSAVQGYYTPATLGQVAQSLSRLALDGDGGALLVA